MTDEIAIAPDSQFDTHPARQILVLQGGGYRGLYTARVLENLETEIGHSILDSFDMIAGTSIGGIIALALADGLSPKAIRQSIENSGPNLFPPNGWMGRRWQFVKRFFMPPHQQTQLKSLVESVLSSTKTLDQLDIEIVVPSCDTNSSPDGPTAVVFNNHQNSRNRTTKLVDVALATSAAPTFFASYQMPETSQQLVDGGVIANSPSWIAMTVALAEYGWDIDYLRMLIVGTTQAPAGHVPKRSKHFTWKQRLFHPLQWLRLRRSEGFLYWLRKGRLLSLIMDGQRRLADGMCIQAMNSGYCLTINSFRSAEQNKVAAVLNQASEKATDTLRSLADEASKVAAMDPAIRQFLGRRAARCRAKPT